MTAKRIPAEGRPGYAPPQRVAVWLSSEDVREAIVRVGQSRQTDTWRACCWDLNHEINKLIATTAVGREGEGGDA